MVTRRCQRADWLKRGRVFWGGHLHEPLYFYRLLAHTQTRGEWTRGRKLAGVDPSAPWLVQWYDLCRSPALLDELAELGVNCLYLNFFKGFGLEYEAAEMHRTASLVAQCAQREIRTVLYVQPSNFIEETLLAETPEARAWLARDAAGNVIHYGASDFRPVACLHHPQWVDYVRQTAQAAAETGADGVLLDNINHNECCCDVSQEAYRTFADDPSADLAADAATPRTMQFRIETTMHLVETVANTVKAVNPQCAVMTNPAWPRAQNVQAAGVDIVRLASATDAFFIENKCFPRVADATLIASSYAYRMADATGTLAVLSAWMPDMSLPEQPYPLRRYLLEPLAFGGHVMCPPWALRPLDERANDRRGPQDVYLHHAPVSEALAACYRFGRSVGALLTEAKPWARVAVVHPTEWFAQDFETAMTCMLSIDAVLAAEHIPYRLVLSDALEADEFDVTIVAQAARLGSSTRKVIDRLAATGAVQTFPRELQGSLHGAPAAAISADARAWAAKLRNAHPSVAPYRVAAPPWVVSFPLSSRDGYLLSLLNYLDTPPTATILNVWRSFWPIKSMAFRTLDGEWQEVTGQTHADSVRFELPDWQVYALCRFDLSTA
ncbi:MAG TPA: hypothetical protein VMZ31_07935 [Phycisphaerae bacterium]|nr:hypothetical protein [Phycisphaerae bacterium]